MVRRQAPTRPAQLRRELAICHPSDQPWRRVTTRVTRLVWARQDPLGRPSTHTVRTRVALVLSKVPTEGTLTKAVRTFRQERTCGKLFQIRPTSSRRQGDLKGAHLPRRSAPRPHQTAGLRLLHRRVPEQGRPHHVQMRTCVPALRRTPPPVLPCQRSAPEGVHVDHVLMAPQVPSQPVVVR